MLCINGRKRSWTSHTSSAVLDGDNLPTARRVAARDILLIRLLLILLFVFLCIQRWKEYLGTRSLSEAEKAAQTDKPPTVMTLNEKLIIL